MVTLTKTFTTQSNAKVRASLGLGVAGVLLTLLAILTLAVMNDQVPSQDQSLMDWVAGWQLPVLRSFFAAISLLTGAKAGLIYGVSGIAILLLMRKTQAALQFAFVGAIVAVVAILGDYTLGETVGRTRPLADSDGPSFPSGHVFGSTVFYGFSGFLALHYGMKKRFLVPLLGLFAFIILSVGPARVYEQAHWPSDVAAGYLLGALWLLVLVPLFLRSRQTVAGSSDTLKVSTSAGSVASYTGEGALQQPGFRGIRVEHSIASRVVLDPQRGTATKVYRPPLVVRLLYWVAFQATFPYVGTPAALQAAVHRRKIAGLLTVHRFGKDLVAPVIAADCTPGDCSFVTEYVEGEKVANTKEVKSFLSKVTDTFAEAGLPVWQMNPRNPHAHTNLIRTPQGDLKIIDLESAIVTPLPAKGQWWSALKNGNVPIFDDIDFLRLNSYISANRAALTASLGVEGMSQLADAVKRGERAAIAWKSAEPRIWGRATRLAYRALDWKPFFQRFKRTLATADNTAEVFLCRGIDRWQREGRISSSEAADLRSRLSSSQAQNALHHLGAHLVLTAAVVVPVPGVRSLARLAWTLGFWAGVQARRWTHAPLEPGTTSENIHTPLVMAVTLLPVLGSVAYLLSRPLRSKLLVRLMFDEVGLRLPFRMYQRTRLDRLVAPALRKADLPTATVPDVPLPSPSPAIITWSMPKEVGSGADLLRAVRRPVASAGPAFLPHRSATGHEPVRGMGVEGSLVAPRNP